MAGFLGHSHTITESAGSLQEQISQHGEVRRMLVLPGVVAGRAGDEDDFRQLGVVGIDLDGDIGLVEGIGGGQRQLSGQAETEQQEEFCFHSWWRAERNRVRFVRW